MARNKFNNDTNINWFNACEISDRYELLEENWEATGNFGAVYRCRCRRREKKITWESADDLGQLSFTELCKVAPEHMKSFIEAGIERDVLMTKILECKKAGRSRTDSIVSNTAESEEDERSNSTIFVVKIIPKQVSTLSLKTNEWMTEREALSELRKHSHFNLVDSNCNNVPKIRESFVSENAVFFVMDFIDGKTLGAIVQSGECFFSNANQVQNNFPRLAELTFQLMQTFLRLHSMNQVHLDIKPDNIMRSQLKGDSVEDVTDTDASDDWFLPCASEADNSTERYIYNIVDFGLCIKVYNLSSMPNKMCALYERGRGTEMFMAPEVRAVSSADILKDDTLEESSDNKVAYTKACDCWSIGATLYYVLTSEKLEIRKDFIKLVSTDKLVSTEDTFLECCTEKVRIFSNNKELQYVRKINKSTPNNSNELIWEDSPFRLIFELTKFDDIWRMNLGQAICHPFLQSHHLGLTQGQAEDSIREITNASSVMSKLRDIEKESIESVGLRRSQSAGKSLEDSANMLEMRRSLEESKLEQDKKNKKHRKQPATSESREKKDGAIFNIISTLQNLGVEKDVVNTIKLSKSHSWNGESLQSIGRVRSFGSEKRSKKDVEQYEYRGIFRSNSRNSMENFADVNENRGLVRTNSRMSAASSEAESNSCPGTPLSRVNSGLNLSGTPLSRVNSGFNLSPSERKVGFSWDEGLLNKLESLEQRIIEINAKLNEHKEMTKNKQEVCLNNIKEARRAIYTKCCACYQWTRTPLPPYVRSLLKDFVPEPYKSLYITRAPPQRYNDPERTKKDVNDLIEKIRIEHNNKQRLFPALAPNVQKCITQLANEYDNFVKCLAEKAKKMLNDELIISIKTSTLKAEKVLANKKGKKSLDRVVEDIEKIMENISESVQICFCL